MRAEIVRIAHPTVNCTQGVLRLDGKDVCYTLEDMERWGPKIKGETAIPLGSYDVLLRRAGGLHDKYINRFPTMHEGMLWLQRVPGFEFIYLHVGNDAVDTEGCPLVGDQLTIDGRVLSSVAAYERVYPMMAHACMNTSLTVTVSRA